MDVFCSMDEVHIDDRDFLALELQCTEYEEVSFDIQIFFSHADFFSASPSFFDITNDSNRSLLALYSCFR
jgi:hypothetical protein